MRSLDRRHFLKTSLVAGAALSLAQRALGAAASAAPGIVDTHVHLFEWPFRKLKYARTDALVAKLKRHRVVEAWAGSFEAVLHKDMAGVNERLAAECRERGQGMLVPFGSVNLAWPDWEEDVRRCHEVFKMRGVRLHPGYQSFDLTHPDLPRLLQVVGERGLLLQIVFQLEDPRVHHPLTKITAADARPLVAALKAAPAAKVQLLHFTGNLQGTDLGPLMRETSAHIDISRWESNGIVGKMIGVAPGGGAARVPLDRVLFGSHAPYFPLETAILKLIESPLTAEQIAAIMHGNARKLIG